MSFLWRMPGPADSLCSMELGPSGGFSVAVDFSRPVFAGAPSTLLRAVSVTFLWRMPGPADSLCSMESHPSGGFSVAVDFSRPMFADETAVSGRAGTPSGGLSEAAADSATLPDCRALAAPAGVELEADAAGETSEHLTATATSLADPAGSDVRSRTGPDGTSWAGLPPLSVLFTSPRHWAAGSDGPQGRSDSCATAKSARSAGPSAATVLTSVDACSWPAA